MDSTCYKYSGQNIKAVLPEIERTKWQCCHEHSKRNIGTIKIRRNQRVRVTPNHWLNDPVQRKNK